MAFDLQARSRDELWEVDKKVQRIVVIPSDLRKIRYFNSPG